MWFLTCKLHEALSSTSVEKQKKAGWLDLDFFKDYYFDVTNQYVVQKLKIIYIPFLHKDWKPRHRGEYDGGE